MTNVLAQPPTMAVAAADVTAIGSAISQANTAAAGATTGVAAAAADEVSTATANLFSAYARQYQAAVKLAGAFHGEFAQALATAANAYAQAEAAASGTLGDLSAPSQALLGPRTGNFGNGAGSAAAVTASKTPVDVALILGASGVPTPDAKYVLAAYNNYISRNFIATTQQVLSTPEGLYPVTGVNDLTLDVSAARGLTILDNALLGQTPGQHGLIIPEGNSVTVFGYSQGAILAALEMPKLVAAGVPTSDVSFVLVGNEVTPNGGMLARFPDLSIPSLGLTFYGGMPANTGYTVYNYTLEYDGFADFPRYPIDVFSDLNAVMGIVFVHPTYLDIPQSQINSAITLPTSPGYDGGSTYYMIPTQNLPLLDPVRAIPYIGQPIADLLQPDLRYLVNWGYGDPNYGWSTGYANVTTPIGLFPQPSATAALGPDLASGAHQGIVAAVGDFRAEGLPSPPPLAQSLLSPSGISDTLRTLPPPTATSVISAVDGVALGGGAAITKIANSLGSAVSTAYGTLSPTGNIAIALVTTLPAYDTTLFLDGIAQAVDGYPLIGLANAITNPIAATFGLGAVAGGVEFLVVLDAADTILTGTPHPTP